MDIISQLKCYRCNIIDENQFVISRMDDRGYYFPLNNMDEVIKFNNTLSEAISSVRHYQEKIESYKAIIDLYSRANAEDRLTVVEKENLDNLLSLVDDEKEIKVTDDSKYLDSFKGFD